MIIIQGITLTPEMVDQIKFWQENKEVLEADIRSIDDAITFIIRQNNSGEYNDANKVLTILSNLCILKDEIKVFKPT